MSYYRRHWTESFLDFSFGLFIVVVCLALTGMIWKVAKNDFLCDEQARIEQKCVDESGHFERECPHD